MTIVTRLWILLSAWLVAAGWVLSAARKLDPVGYLAALAIGTAVLLWWQWREAREWFENWKPLFHRFCRRCRRPAPLAFLLLVGLALADGVIYPPMPLDESMYRTPRVLHWLAQGGWHWIRSFDIRMNILNCGFEWLTAPLLLFTRTDRLFSLSMCSRSRCCPG